VIILSQSKLVVVGILAMVAMFALGQTSTTGEYSFDKRFQRFDQQPEYLCMVNHVLDQARSTRNSLDNERQQKEEYFSGNIQRYKVTGSPGEILLDHQWGQVAVVRHRQRLTTWDLGVYCDTAVPRCTRDQRKIRDLMPMCRTWFRHYRTSRPECCDNRPDLPQVERAYGRTIYPDPYRVTVRTGEEDEESEVTSKKSKSIDELECGKNANQDLLLCARTKKCCQDKTTVGSSILKGGT